jgi:hypothetical protein
MYSEIDDICLQLEMRYGTLRTYFAWTGLVFCIHVAMRTYMLSTRVSIRSHCHAYQAQIGYSNTRARFLVFMLIPKVFAVRRGTGTYQWVKYLSYLESISRSSIFSYI